MSEEQEDKLAKMFAVVFDDDSIHEAFDRLENVVSEKATAAAEALNRPQDDAVMFTIGMLLTYRKSRSWLRNMERLCDGINHPTIGDLIRDTISQYDPEIDLLAQQGEE